MQIGALLQALEVEGRFEVLLHHIQEAIIILDRTPRILHQQRSRFSQYPAHFPTQLTHFTPHLPLPGRQIRR